MPIIHLPTFHIDEADPLLVASMISLGATFSRLPGSKTFSTELVEVVRRCINVLFELDSANVSHGAAGKQDGRRSKPGSFVDVAAQRRPGPRLDAVLHFRIVEWDQAELRDGRGGPRCLGYRECAIEDQPTEPARDRPLMSCLCSLQLCRRADLLNSSSSLRQLAPTDNGGSDSSGRWLRWARAESRKRLGTCICLLDSMFPAMLDTPAYISQGQMTGMVLPCDEVYWQATSARMWTDSLGIAGIPPSPLFASA